MTKKLLSNIKKDSNANIAPSFHAELFGNGKNISLLISGVRAINEFSQTSILLSLRKELISVRGSLLEISVLESRNIRITGKIDNLTFLSGRGAKK